MAASYFINNKEECGNGFGTYGRYHHLTVMTNDTQENFTLDTYVKNNKFYRILW